MGWRSVIPFQINGWTRAGRWMAVVAVVGCLQGCAQHVTFRQADYINTAMHWGRAPSQRTGEPLEINIVRVRSKDLKIATNDRLRPDRNISSDVWFANRPILGDDLEKAETGGRFWLPKSQILVMTYDPEYYGTRIGDPLRGAATDKKKEIKTSVSASGMFSNVTSAIYVFAKFVDENGNVLPIAPARLRSPGRGDRELIVEIGVDESRGDFGQYIEVR